MCLACEQDAMWFAYLQRRGLITPDGYLVENPPFPFAADPVPPQDHATQLAQEFPQQAGQPQADKQEPGRGADNAFSCDDPAAG